MVLIEPTEPERERSDSADILLCHNCGWNASLQIHNGYVSHIKCFFGKHTRGAWMIGDDYVLKERAITPVWGPAIMGPDAETTNWARRHNGSSDS